jgi:sugar lactone lactonase YvrE
MLAACGGSQPPIGPPGAISQTVNSQSHENVKPPSVMPAYKVSGPLLFVANIDFTLTPLGIYNADADNPKPLATISEDIDNSLGACIDGDGTLYVANYPNDGDATGWISEYALGQTRPLRVITTGINYPTFCATDASGNLWVSNAGLPDVAEYLKGSTKPYATITTGLTWPQGIAFDHAGNLYVANFEPYKIANVQVYAPGGASPSRTITNGVMSPYGIAVDAHDTLYVTNAYSPSSIEEYRSGQSKPYRTITDKLFLPLGVVVGKNGWLYVANEGETSEMAVLEFPPHSLTPSREITKGLFNPFGVAYYPPLSP